MPELDPGSDQEAGVAESVLPVPLPTACRTGGGTLARARGAYDIIHMFAPSQMGVSDSIAALNFDRYKECAPHSNRSPTHHHIQLVQN